MPRLYFAYFHRLDLIHWRGKTVFSHAVHLCGVWRVFYEIQVACLLCESVFVCARAFASAFKKKYLIDRRTFFESAMIAAADSGSVADEGHG